MSTKFEYTTLAHRYTARFPVLTYVGTQMNFWIIANTLLFAVLHMHSRIINEVFTVPVSERLGTPWLLAIVLGLFYGVILGLIGYYLDKNIFRKSALGKIILLKTLTSLTVLILILLALRYVFFDSLTADVRMTDDAWKSFFWLLVIYYFFMTFLISFINQVNRKYGPGILLPLLLGHYREPKEEDRIFMFMDLTASTSLAEELGHLNYSSFIRDCFADINEILYDYQAQVYQYVGDEIVVT